MAEIDSIGTAYYYAGLKTATAKSQKDKEAEKTSSTKKTRFSDILKNTSAQEATETQSIFPKEIEGMNVTDAAIYLKEEVEKAGNLLSSEITMENLQKFKESIKAFLTYIEKNNFEVKTTVVMDRRHRTPVMSSPLPVFSSYQTPPTKKTKTTFTVINEKLDELTREMLSLQADNIKILAQVEDIKGLIIDLID